MTKYVRITPPRPETPKEQEQSTLEGSQDQAIRNFNNKYSEVVNKLSIFDINIEQLMKHLQKTIQTGPIT